MDSADRKFCDLFGNPSMSTQLKASVYFSIIVWQYFRSGRFNFRSFGAGCANIVINLWMSTGIWCATTTTTHLKTLPTDKDTGRNYAFELKYIYAGLFGTREQDQTFTKKEHHSGQMPSPGWAAAHTSVNQPKNNASNWQHAHLQWINLIMVLL